MRDEKNEGEDSTFEGRDRRPEVIDFRSSVKQFSGESNENALQLSNFQAEPKKTIEFDDWAGPEKEKEAPGEVSVSYKMFVNRNVNNLEIISLYCDELVTTPYQENLQNDIMLGKWLDEVTPRLSQDLFPLIQEVAKYHIDTSILDIYKNLMIQVSKRYSIQLKLAVRFRSRIGAR